MPRVVFNSPTDLEIEIEVETGTTVLQAAWDNNIDIEGACEGAIACSTCHVIVSDIFFWKLANATEEEQDLLDLAWGVQPNSRLGCQIVITPELDGIKLTVPALSNNQM
ncbi:MAG: 2Fe-2S iron-sulfur cluster-binding protein [Pseudomonadota bacterium]|nr:2Fe-2S iron-sulfur cluster-binding protein [Pseudomonadota bacterium]